MLLQLQSHPSSQARAQKARAKTGWAPVAVAAPTTFAPSPPPPVSPPLHPPLTPPPQVGAACKETGALFVLDCIASGTVWVDMKKLGIDVVISAPQKGWSGPAVSVSQPAAAPSADR